MTTATPPTTTGSGSLVNIAQPWYNAGVSVVPVLPGGNKKPALRWEALQRERLTQPQVDGYWRPGSDYGVAAICGAVSGNLEMTELEMDAASQADLNAVGRECRLRGVEDIWDQLLNVGYMEWTPSGGIHLLYRVPEHEIPGNTKLAMRIAQDNELTEGEQKLRETNPHQVFWRTRAETRGEGGYVVVAPTSGLCHKSGEAWIVGAGLVGEIPTITWHQRMELHAAITAALDQTPPAPPPAPRTQVAVRTDSDLRPGDTWADQHDWDEPWFTSQGWTVSHRVGSETFWVRPGKDVRDGHSASTGYNGEKDRLYIWSTAVGLPTETPLSKFFIYAHYYHHGDMSAAASYLRRENQSDTLDPYLGAKPRNTPLPWTPDVNHPVSLPPHGGLDLTDTGSGRRMKELFGDRFRYNTRDKFWYEWNGSAWKKDESLAIWRAAVYCAEKTVVEATQMLNDAEILGDDDIIKRARKRLADATGLKNKGKIESAMAMFAQEPGMALTTDSFDVDLNLLNLANGTWDLESGELLPHDPSNLMTLTMGAKYDKDAECPKFRQFMVDSFPDETIRDYVQRCMGYSLLGTASERTLFMLHGPSGTGKSVLTSVMTQVFGGYGSTAPASTFRMKKQSETLDLHKLKGARFVATSEMPEGQLLDEDLVKRISGGDMMTSRGHYEAFTDWQASCVIWIATNFLPKVNSDDNAIWRRAKTIPMRQEVSAADEVGKYANVLAKEEADGIFNWLLEGLHQYRMQGLNQPAAITADVEAYRVDVNLTASFIRDKIEEGVIAREEESDARSSQLWAMFEQYCNENHQQTLGARRFQNQLKTLGFEPVKVGGKALWKGLRINLEYGVLGSMSG